MRIAQRGTSSTSSGYHTVDRFAVQFGGTDEAATQAQVDVASGTSPYTNGFRKALKITNGNQSSGAGAADYMRYRIRIEAQDIANSGWNYTSSSSYITLSFWIKSSVAQNFYGHLHAVDGTQQGYPFETGSLTADTWTKITKTIPGNSNLTFDNNAELGWNMDITMFMGTDNTTSGNTMNQWYAYSSSNEMPDNTPTWYTTNSATWEITGMQLEVGDTATSFEHRSYGEELTRCHRYYQKLSGDVLTYYGVGNVDGATMAQILVNFVTEMRAAPGGMDTSGTNGDYTIRMNSNATCTQQPALSNRTTKNAMVIFYASGHGFTNGQACFARAANNTNGFLGFSAEL